jgi:cell wall-associated NlpC family hydrolase
MSPTLRDSRMVRTLWFRSDRPDRLAALQKEAARWEGTPFLPNSCSPGPKGGVCCHKLVGALYRAAGTLLVELPDAPAAHARFNATSIIEPWLDGRNEFERIPVPVAQEIIPGDLLGFRLLRILHHIGVCIEPGVFLHTIEHLGTVRSAIEDATWRRRLMAIWRPVEP